MTARGTPPAPTFGFLTIVEDAEQGRFGGYLALNPAGRPLEFHCTAPVKASRAQEILYGASLAPFLEGELIGGALLARAKSPPWVVFTDRLAALSLRHTAAAPVVLTLPEETEDAAPPETASPTPNIRTARTASVACSSPRPIAFSLGGNRVAVDAAFENDQALVIERCADLLRDFDLAEPFVRIREALREARSTAGAGRSSRPAAAG